MIPVNVLKTTILTPKQTQLIDIKIRKVTDSVNFQHLVIQGTAAIGKKGVKVAEAIVPTGYINQLKIFVTNSTNSEITLNENQKIANCDQINENWKIQKLNMRSKNL